MMSILPPAIFTFPPHSKYLLPLSPSFVLFSPHSIYIIISSSPQLFLVSFTFQLFSCFPHFNNLVVSPNFIRSSSLKLFPCSHSNYFLYFSSFNIFSYFSLAPNIFLFIPVQVLHHFNFSQFLCTPTITPIISSFSPHSNLFSFSSYSITSFRFHPNYFLISSSLKVFHRFPLTPNISSFPPSLQLLRRVPLILVFSFPSVQLFPHSPLTPTIPHITIIPNILSFLLPTIFLFPKLVILNFGKAYFTIS